MQKPQLHRTANIRGGSYRRGAVMGLTMAEAFILISFALLLLFTFWQWEIVQENTEEVRDFKLFKPEQQRLMMMLYQQKQSEPEGLVSVEHRELERLERIARELQIEEIIRFKELPVEQQKSVLEALEHGKLDDEDNWRFINESELKRLLDGAAKLPKDVRHQLADLVEAKEAQKILSELGALEEIIAAGQSLSGISDKIGQVQAQEAALAEALRREIGDIVASTEGEISNNGVITLPESVVFQQGSDEISKRLHGFLQKACEPWLNVLKESEVHISEVRIEGHASSEWRSGATIDESYLGNLGLSQKRSQNVLLACLSYIKANDIKTWARSHLVAVGHSSARPLLTDDGNEDANKSRRVVFRATPDREQLLSDIEGQAQDALSRIPERRDDPGGDHGQVQEPVERAP